MEREIALQDYEKAVAGAISDFHSYIGEYLVQHAGYLEKLVRDGMLLLGKQMEKQGKEYVCFIYFSWLKIDLINRKYRILLHGLDARWYLDDEPAEVYVDATELFEPFDKLRDALEEANRGYGGAVNDYDVRKLLFAELPFLDSCTCQVLRYVLRDWEEKGIFEPVTRSPYWLLKWGEYRDRAEFLVQTDRVAKPASAWKKELTKAVHDPEHMVFSYWYKRNCEKKSPKGIDMRFSTFEECNLRDLAFENCNMEGSRFTRSSIVNCSFAGCNLSGADFRNSRFENTSFAGAELTAAIFPAESIPFLEISAEQLQVICIDRGENA